MRRELVTRVRETLIKAEFNVSEEHHLKSISFDLVARRDNLLLFIKVVTNVDALSEENAQELKLLSNILGGFALSVGEHCGSGPLDDDVIYSRFGIPIMTLETLRQYFVEETAPVIFAAPGGYYVRLDGGMLRRIRETRGISLGDVADAAGVSRRSIQLYEEGGRRALVDVALRIEDYLGVPLICPVDPVLSSHDVNVDDFKDSLGSITETFQAAFAHLMDAGCHVVSTSHSPFETLLEEKRDIMLTGVATYERSLVKKAKVIGDVSCIVEKESVVVVDRKSRREEIDGTPIVSIQEILERGTLEEILELIKERAKDGNAR